MEQFACDVSRPGGRRFAVLLPPSVAASVCLLQGTVRIKTEGEIGDQKAGD
jgi:hypothetical protein